MGALIPIVSQILQFCLAFKQSTSLLDKLHNKIN